MTGDPSSPEDEENLKKIEQVIEKTQQIAEKLPDNKYVYLIMGQANMKARYL